MRKTRGDAAEKIKDIADSAGGNKVTHLRGVFEEFFGHRKGPLASLA
jgi:hypothetical protein